MTDRQEIELGGYVEQVRAGDMDSLEFAQLIFDVEGLVEEDESYTHPLLSDLIVAVKTHYPGEFDEWVSQSKGAVRVVLLRHGSFCCPHWQQEGDGMYEWRRFCTNNSYNAPEGGEPSEFCPDCGGKVEILDSEPNS